MQKFAGYAAHNCVNCGNNRVFFKFRTRWNQNDQRFMSTYDQSTVYCCGCNAPSRAASTEGVCV